MRLSDEMFREVGSSSSIAPNGAKKSIQEDIASVEEKMDSLKSNLSKEDRIVLDKASVIVLENMGEFMKAMPPMQVLSLMAILGAVGLKPDKQ